eukprot:4355394-Pyramimonas_sp.AAC.1
MLGINHFSPPEHAMASTGMDQIAGIRLYSPPKHVMMCIGSTHCDRDRVPLRESDTRDQAGLAAQACDDLNWNRPFRQGARSIPGIRNQGSGHSRPPNMR